MDISPQGREDAHFETDLLQAGFSYALSLTHHRQNAEDLIQEAWLKLNRRYGVVTSQAALFTTVRNLFIDSCRRQRVIAFESLEQGVRCGSTPQRILPGTQPDLEMLLATLRPSEREAIFLHHVHGHTAGEIAVLTDQPRGTVLSLLHRAFEKLRRTVKSTPPESGIAGRVAIDPPVRSSVAEAP